MWFCFKNNNNSSLSVGFCAVLSYWPLENILTKKNKAYKKKLYLWMNFFFEGNLILATLFIFYVINRKGK